MSVVSSISDLAQRAAAEFKAARTLAASGNAANAVAGVITSSEIASLAAAGQLVRNRLYTITDDGRLVVARSNSSFAEV